MSDKGTQSNPVTGERLPRIQEEPNLSACPGNIDGHKEDILEVPDLPTVEQGPTVPVEVY